VNLQSIEPIPALFGRTQPDVDKRFLLETSGRISFGQTGLQKPRSPVQIRAAPPTFPQDFEDPGTEADLERAGLQCIFSLSVQAGKGTKRKAGKKR
jgi:hypothetical protein